MASHTRRLYDPFLDPTAWSYKPPGYPFHRNFKRDFDKVLDEITNPQSSLDSDSLDQTSEQQYGGAKKVSNDSAEFVVELDASKFVPNELSVGVRRREIIIEGKHADGNLHHNFTRRYELPDDANVEDIKCTLSDMGTLRIRVAKIKDADKVRQIPISRETANKHEK
ncbi:hypothetical protein AB6A40_008927 [Gnathostoma spinigerum]|uniref:SHSP domain-containing protein n=1 Tax=Gnathostoma spinigerum TaxID=75299 RepID=A0ABD6EQU4_9BILA